MGIVMYVGPAEFARGATVVGLRLDAKRTTTDCDGKYKVRTNPELSDDIQASVCKAVLDWESREGPSERRGTVEG